MCGQDECGLRGGCCAETSSGVDEGALGSMVKQMVQSSLIDAKLAASTPITAYYDNRYVEEVKRSGFFDQLWK